MGIKSGCLSLFSAALSGRTPADTREFGAVRVLHLIVVFGCRRAAGMPQGVRYLVPRGGRQWCCVGGDIRRGMAQYPLVVQVALY